MYIYMYMYGPCSIHIIISNAYCMTILIYRYIALTTGSDQMVVLDFNSIRKRSRQLVLQANAIYMSSASTAAASETDRRAEKAAVASIESHKSYYSHSKLQGFAAITTVSIEHDGAPGPGGYRAVYRLLCGKGVGLYNIWQVTVTSAPTAFSAYWELLITNSLPRPSNSLDFGCFEAAGPAHIGGQLRLWGGPASDVCDSPEGRQATSRVIDLSSPIRSPRFGSPAQPPAGPQRFEFIVVPNYGLGLRSCVVNLAPLQLPSTSSSSSSSSTSLATPLTATCKPIVAAVKPLPDGIRIHCASKDGTILFGSIEGSSFFYVIKVIPTLNSTGLPDEAPLRGTVIAYEKFDLKHAQGPEDSLDPVREPRQQPIIETVECTDDGAYAFITCSDGTACLWSVCDVFGCGVTAKERYCVNAEEGSAVTTSFLTLLFQIATWVKFRVQISYAIPYKTDDCLSAAPMDLTCQSCQAADRISRPHLAPEHVVVVVVAWWLHWSPKHGGVVKNSYLVDRPATSRTSSNTSSTASQPARRTMSVLASPHVTYPGVGLTRAADGPDAPAPSCLCGDAHPHWPESVEPWQVPASNAGAPNSYTYPTHASSSTTTSRVDKKRSTLRINDVTAERRDVEEARQLKPAKPIKPSSKKQRHSESSDTNVISNEPIKGERRQSAPADLSSTKLPPSPPATKHVAAEVKPSVDAGKSTAVKEEKHDIPIPTLLTTCSTSALQSSSAKPLPVAQPAPSDVLGHAEEPMVPLRVLEVMRCNHDSIV